MRKAERSAKKRGSLGVLDALDLYLVQLAADGRSEHTVDQARRHVRKFATWNGDVRVDEVGHEDVARFLASSAVRKCEDGRERKASSGNALRSSLRGFFGYAHASGLTRTNAARLVRRAMCPAPRPKALSDADCAKLLAALDTAGTRAEMRDRALFTTMLRTGIRVGNAVALAIEDVDLDACEIRLRRMKGGDEDVAFFPRELAGVLRMQIGERTSGPVFPNANGGALTTRMVAKRLEAWAKRAGIERRVWPHCLRHTFGMRVFAKTGDVLLTSNTMCHRSLASTAVYARPDAAKVRAAVAL
jgi:site-specific recombinase XerD